MQALMKTNHVAAPSRSPPRPRRPVASATIAAVLPDASAIAAVLPDASAVAATAGRSPLHLALSSWLLRR